MCVMSNDYGMMLYVMWHCSTNVNWQHVALYASTDSTDMIGEKENDEGIGTFFPSLFVLRFCREESREGWW